MKVVIKGADGSAISTLTGTYPKAVLANPQVPAAGSLDVSGTPALSLVPPPLRALHCSLVAELYRV